MQLTIDVLIVLRKLLSFNLPSFYTYSKLRLRPSPVLLKQLTSNTKYRFYNTKIILEYFYLIFCKILSSQISECKFLVAIAPSLQWRLTHLTLFIRSSEAVFMFPRLYPFLLPRLVMHRHFFFHQYEKATSTNFSGRNPIYFTGITNVASI